MKTINPLAWCAALTLAASASPSIAQQGLDPALTAPVKAYATAANAADLNGVMAVYADDAVFMPQNSSPVVGKPAVRTAYAALFNTLGLDIDFTFDEARKLSDDWAFVRTRSGGTVKLIQQGNAQVPNANQEIFLLRRGGDGTWRIARYIFNTTAPAQ